MQGETNSRVILLKNKLRKMKRLILIVAVFFTLNSFAQIDSSNIMYKRGFEDATRYYKGHKGAATGTLLTTSILTPIAGIIPALITTSSKVKEQNLNYPNADLFANKDYQEGYILRANQRKKRKTWINYAIGSGVSLMVLAAISAGVQASNY